MASSTTATPAKSLAAPSADAVMAVTPTADVAHSEVEQEQRLIRAVLAGNVNAYQTLVETHQSRVYGLALRLLGNEREAEDAAQDAFVQAFTKLASYNPEWRFKTWIMTIVNNLCIDRLRRRKLEPTSFTDYATPKNGDSEARELEFESHEPLPDTTAVVNEQRKIIQTLLQTLPVEDRGMVMMFYWNDMSYADIAKMTNSTVSAVKSRLFRARRALAQNPLAKQVLEA